MTVTEFRKFALSHPETTEGAHMDHPDFRVRGKIFATLGYPSTAHRVVRLTSNQQQALVDRDPDTFVPAAGAWGRKGMTTIRLRTAPKEIVRKAVSNAWCNTAPRPLVRAASAAAK